MEFLQIRARLEPANLLDCIATNEELLQVVQGLKVFHHLNLVILQVQVREVLGKAEVFDHPYPEILKCQCPSKVTVERTFEKRLPVVSEEQTLQVHASLQPFDDINLLVAQVHVRKALQEVFVLLLLAPPLRRST